MEWQDPLVRHFLIGRRPKPIDREYRELMFQVVFGLRPARPYPFRLSELHAFVQLSDAIGTYEFTIELYESGGHVPIACSEPDAFTFTDRLAVYSFTRLFQNLPFRASGLYEFRLFARATHTSSGMPVANQLRRGLATETLMMEAFE